MKRKKLAALGLAILMAVGTAACGSGSESGGKNDEKPVEDTASDAAQDTGSGDASGTETASGEKVKLQFYSWSDETAYLDPAVAAYNAQSEVAEVEVTYFPPTEYAEKILATFASGTEFDVLCVNGLSPYGEYKSKDTIQEISAYVEASGLDTEIYGDVFKTSNEDGLYGLPYRGAVWLMFANEALFEKAGGPFSQEQLTWDEYRDLAKQLTKDGTYGGLVGMDNFVLLQQLGGSVMDEDTGKIRQSLELWKALEDDGGHVPFAEKLECRLPVYLRPGRICGDFPERNMGRCELQLQIRDGRDALPVQGNAHAGSRRRGGLHGSQLHQLSFYRKVLQASRGSL